MPPKRSSRTSKRIAKPAEDDSPDEVEKAEVKEAPTEDKTAEVEEESMKIDEVVTAEVEATSEEPPAKKSRSSSISKTSKNDEKAAKVKETLKQLLLKRPEEATPNAEEVSPKVEEVIAKTEKSSAKVEKQDPKSDKKDPKAEKPTSKVEKSDPKADEPDSKADEPTPNVEKLDPKAEKVNPKVEKSNPKTEKADSKVEKPNPKVEKPEPKAGKTDSKAENGAPKTDEPAPKTEEHAPKTTESTPEVPKDTPDTETEEPAAKKLRVAEDAVKKIEAAKAKIASEALEAETALRKAKTAELDKFWRAVKEDPSDFTGWTYLLQHVDSKNDIVSGREAFSAFLKRYPYCYGYWKKFADFEKRNGEKERTMAVFDQGLAAIPLSADLWIHFLNHQKFLAAESGDKEMVRSSYERAVAECGREWRSDKLWDHYVNWETEGADLPRVFSLYQRLLKFPTQGVSHQLEKCKDFIKKHNPKDLVDTAEFLAMRKEVLGSLKGGGDTADAAPGEDTEAAMANDEETEAIREKMMFGLRKLYKDTEERVSLRWKFEEGIKRPYFHVKGLERGQLKNWKDYLDFMKVEMGKEGGDLTEVEILFERCLIACALYEEFWLSYVEWWEGREDKKEEEKTAMIRSIYKRACMSHLPKKVDIHCRWAAWEERCGSVEEAASILENLEQAHPGLVSVLLRRVNLERRRGKAESACELYQVAIHGAKTGVASDLAVKYSRFLRLAQGDSTKAAQVLQSALDLDPTNPKLYLQQLDLILHTSPLDVAAVVELLDKAQAAEGIADKHKLLFAQRKVEFLQDFGHDIASLEEAEAQFAQMNKKKAEEKKEEPGRSIPSIEGRTGKEKGGAHNGNGSASTSYPPTANSAQYGAAQTAAFNQYGARYSGYSGPGSYGQWGYPGYAPQSS